jgi:hypothetical protein
MSAAAAMGTGYMEFFTSFLGRAFRWLCNFFDYKVVPNVPYTPTAPSNPWSVYNGWSTAPHKTNDFMSMAEQSKSWFHSPFGTPAPTSWFDSWKTWIYVVGGIITITAIVTSGVYIHQWWTYIPPVTPNTALAVETETNTVANSNTGLIRKISDVLIFNRISNIVNACSAVTHKFLPYVSKEDLDATQFAEIPQSRKNMGYYPFNRYDPSNPWYTRIRKQLLGETVQELAERMEHRQQA